MAYFPFFVDIENQDCLIAGGGAVALRKVEVLLPYGPRITVVSPEIGPEMEALANGRETGGQEAEIILKRRPFSMEDLDGRDFVIAATDNEELNHRISEACKAQRIPVNVVDGRGHCGGDFLRRKEPYRNPIFKKPGAPGDPKRVWKTGRSAWKLPGFCKREGSGCGLPRRDFQTHGGLGERKWLPVG